MSRGRVTLEPFGRIAAMKQAAQPAIASVTTNLNEGDEGTPTRVSNAAQMALTMLAFFTTRLLEVFISLLAAGRGWGASSTAQTTLPPSAVGSTPNVRER